MRLARHPMHPGPFAPIFRAKAKKHPEEQRHDPDRLSRPRHPSSAPSLRDRLKDPSLLREQCYIDGAWTGTPSNPVTNPVNGVELAKVPKLEHRGSDAGRRSRRARVPGLGQIHRQAALQHPAQMVRPDHRQPRGSRADPDLRAGQAAGGGARRSRYRRRLCRILRRGGAPRLRRNHSDAAAGRAAARDQASRSASAARSRRGIFRAR